MQVRYPDFDFRDSVPHWGDNREAVTVIHGGAIIPPPIERYVIKVLRQARELLRPVADAKLLADISVFNQQEAQHFKIHTDRRSAAITAPCRCSSGCGTWRATRRSWPPGPDPREIGGRPYTPLPPVLTVRSASRSRW